MTKEIIALTLFFSLALPAGTAVCGHAAPTGQERPDSAAFPAKTDPNPEVYVTEAADTVPVRKKKDNIFRKIYRYFAESNEYKEHKRFDFSIIGGPHYSTDIKLGLGLVAAGTYKTKFGDPDTPLSNVSLFGDITTTGFYLLGVRGNNIFPKEKYRIDYTLYFFSMPSAFWGIGYKNNDNDRNASKYKRMQNQAKIDFLVKLGRYTYLGPSLSFDFVLGKDFTDIALLQGQSRRTTYLSAGAVFIYDSRDFIPNAYKGLYLKLEQRVYPAVLPGNKWFGRTAATFDWYRQVWKGGVVATDLMTEFNYGRPPWTMVSLMGGSYRMRGYYEGRYRDNNMITAQVELRQRIWRRIGAVAWAGAGNVFRSFDRFDLSHTLPNYGLGARWEFKRRMNVRLDYGFGKRDQRGFLFSINEAF